MKPYYYVSMQRLIALSTLLLVLSSAQSKPSLELLTQDQMVSILVDLELAKAMVAYYTDNEATASQLLKENALLIYQAHDVSPDTFQASYRYYLSHLESMKEIYETVIERLEELEAPA